VAAVSCPASALAFPLAAVTAAADLLVFLHRWAVVARVNRRSTRLIVCFALTVTTVRGQSRRRASQHEEQSSQKDESTDDEPPRDERQARHISAERFQMPTSTWK
jgi:hypothetical protein